MSNSIFTLGDLFGIESPFDNWDPGSTLSITYLKTDFIKDGETEQFQIFFKVISQIADPTALLTLYSNEEGTAQLKLSKKVNTTPIVVGTNEYSIKFNHADYKTHLKAKPDVQFYIGAKVNGTEYTGSSFKLPYYQAKLINVTRDKSLTVVNLELSSTDLINKKIAFQGYQKINEKNSFIEKLGKDVVISKNLENITFSILDSTITKREKDGTLYSIYCTVSGFTQILDSIELRPKAVSETIKPASVSVSDDCGKSLYSKDIYCTRYNIGTDKNKQPIYQYGPAYDGSLTLANYPGWESMLADKRITEENKNILVVMSANEGKLDSVQSYDGEVITVGAMQKTMKDTGKGEFPTQLSEFKASQPELFKELFEGCGWTVEGTGASAKASYKGVTGEELRKQIMNGFNAANRGWSKRASTPSVPAFFPIIKACKNYEFQAKQVEDLISRMGEALSKPLTDYPKKTVGDFISTSLGKATVLDHSVNRPNHVGFYFNAALTKFFTANPGVSKDPATWKDKHKTYEKKLLDIYGPLREKKLTSGDGMTDGNQRYLNLVAKLPIT